METFWIENFVTEFKASCSELENELATYLDLLNIRRESSSTDYSMQYLFEIIIASRTNVDDYGIVFGLIIKKEKENGLIPIELSAIRGDGPILKLNNFLLGQQSDILGLNEQFKSSLEEITHEILYILKKDYVNG